MRLRGSFRPPGDKSISHRVALLSLLAAGECVVENYAKARDTETTLAAVRALGGDTGPVSPRTLLLRGAEGRMAQGGLVACGNSGTTMRLLMGILAGRPGEFLLDGDDSLRQRPMERVAAPLRQMGARVACTDGKAPVTISGGPLTGMDFTLPVASAQLKSALLLAGIQAQGETWVTEPAPSRDHTERLLVLCRAQIHGFPCHWFVQRSSLHLPRTLWIPGDISSAAFFLGMAAILPGSQVLAERVLLNPLRTGFLKVLSCMGAGLRVEERGSQPEPWGDVQVTFSPHLQGCEVKTAEIPALVDEVPILALVATQARGVTIFRGVGELRLKESDRLAALVDQLGLMGARLRVEGEDLVVEGSTPLRCPGRLRSWGDHRIAMTLRLAASLTDRDPFIEEEASVAVSYPSFLETLKELGS